MKKPLVSIIIVNWNGAEILHDCLKSVFSQAYKNIEVVVVDNNSLDNSKEIIKKYSRVKLVESNKNLGFVGGNNLGYRYVKGKYILLLNTDAMLTRDSLIRLVEFCEKESGVGVVQPKILYSQESKTKKEIINSIGAYLTATGFLYYPGYGKIDKKSSFNKTRQIFTAHGACMLIRKEVIEKVGFFDPDFFMYFEETDFCMRASIAGWKVMFFPDVHVFHKGAVSSKKFGLEKIYYHSFKNRICTYIKNLQIGQLLLILPIHLLVCEITSLLYIVTGKMKYFISIQKALLWNIRNIKNIIKKRKRVQNKLRKIDDKTYFLHVYHNPRFVYYIYLFIGLQYYKD